MGFDVAVLTPLTATWLLAALVGLYFAAQNLTAALADRKAARAEHNGLYASRVLVTQGAVFRNRIRVAIFGWWTLLGIGFGFFDLSDLPRLGGTLGLVATVFGWSVIGAQEIRERRELNKRVTHEEAVRLAALRVEERERLAPLTAQVERMADSMDNVAEKAAVAAAPRAAKARSEDKDFGDKRRELEAKHREEDDQAKAE